MFRCIASRFSRVLRSSSDIFTTPRVSVSSVTKAFLEYGNHFQRFIHCAFTVSLAYSISFGVMPVSRVSPLMSPNENSVLSSAISIYLVLTTTLVSEPLNSLSVRG